MGFKDFIGKQFLDIIEWEDATNDTLVYKFPMKDNEIQNGAQLTVRPGQNAVFVEEGKVADVFSEGMYKLETKNLPILADIKGWNTVKSPEPAYRPIDANLAGLKSKDPLFHDEVFLSKINNMFLQLQQAWMEKQWNSIRPFETDPLFNMHNRQLQSYIDQHKTNVVENIAILESKIVRYENDGSNDELDVYIKARMNDYVIDDHTKKVLKGNPDRDIHMSYIWTLIRKETVLTETQKEKYDVTQCPNCGANVSINASGQCEYCDSVISSGEYDWVLSKIKVISQK
ncbi:SPFH domain-containing protein [Peribacillus sp. NPDC046944]|uniref:SPFH domain-containing protein n=1 Tax=unclassified Peribacillus TaxID=2675266 RepID=UPI003D02331F